MRIGPNTVVAINYTVRLDSGEIVDSTKAEEPLTFAFGREEILPGLEQALTGLAPGDRRDVVLPPDEAYGSYRPEAVHEVPLDRFPDEIRPEVGMQLAVRGKEGEEVPVTITAVSSTHASLDFNHPLAGEQLSFQVHVIEVRPAPGAGQRSAAGRAGS